ncbi:F-box protein [Senna tora]|uniref:F-box protein n=1 Tax=Senna tora TaxID=362788 RepID=A0A834SZS4_9FABA|nr:F-box protein [Senna tora]
MIMASENTLMVINVFKRRQIKVPNTPNPGSFYNKYDRAILSYAMNSQEFVIVALCSTWGYDLNVYQSKNSAWTIYSRWRYPLTVVDVVVHNRTLYAITQDAKIGKLMFNSPEVMVLELNNIPFFLSDNLNLVGSDRQLLVVHFKACTYLEVYKIDLSAMEWSRIHMIGDCALFISGTKCTSLSNPVNLNNLLDFV